MAAAPVSGPVRVAVVNDYEIVVRGVHALLAPYPDRVRVVEMNSDTDPITHVDVALYDAFSMEGADGQPIAELLRMPNVAKLAVYTWNLQPDDVQAAIQRGVRGLLSKTLGGEHLVAAIEAVHAGEVVVHPPPAQIEFDAGDWPGRPAGLTARESEIVCLIVRGLSNNEIAARSYLSINSVKSYIRSAYRTMGVTTRSQAILWGMDHGMRGVPTRIIPATLGLAGQETDGAAAAAS